MTRWPQKRFSATTDSGRVVEIVATQTVIQWSTAAGESGEVAGCIELRLSTGETVQFVSDGVFDIFSHGRRIEQARCDPADVPDITVVWPESERDAAFPEFQGLDTEDVCRLLMICAESNHPSDVRFSGRCREFIARYGYGSRLGMPAHLVDGPANYGSSTARADSEQFKKRLER